MKTHDDDNDNPAMTGRSDRTPDYFDRLMGSLDGLPDVAQTKEATKRVVPPLGIGGASTYIVQTFRQKDTNALGKTISRDTIFLEHISEGGTVRLVIPPVIADIIARQRESLTTMVRKRTAKRVAADRKAQGIPPAFLKRRAQ